MNREKASKQVLLVKTGDTIEKIKPQHGDFEHWFARYCGISNFVQVDVFRQQELPAPDAMAGVVITGSAAMVSDREDWSERTAGWLKTVLDKKVPVLGVCYGHQLLAHALGGRVGPNPQGRQIGTVEAKLTREGWADTLLGYLPGTFLAQTTHIESVLELPSGSERLASSPRDQNFAIRFTDCAWGLQFHPEFSASVMSEYIRLRADALINEGMDPAYLLQQVRDTPEACSTLVSFRKMLL